MATEKAVMFVDNSNIFKGMDAFTRYLRRIGTLQEQQYLRIKWDSLIRILESQDSGLDIFARHFFASLPPAANVSKLRHRPTEDEWEKLVRESAQTGFYKIIQDPPFNFTLHAVPLRFAEVRCGIRMRQAYYKCLNAYDGKLQCKLSLDPDECYGCEKSFLFKYEKGVDVALAAELVIFGAMKAVGFQRIILVAGDGDYKEAIRYLRRDLGKDVQIVSWKAALSKELVKLKNKDTIILDDHWEELCERRRKPPLEEAPAIEEEESTEEEE
jgi:hypothetical protein